MAESVTLTTDMLIVMAILALTIYLFVSEIVRVDVAAIIVMLTVGLVGLVPSEELFNGFASNAVISIIAVMIVGAGLDRTGLMSTLAGYILKVGGSAEKRIIPIISATASGISSFMQNVGAAALFLPVVSRISTRTGLPLSRLLMPMGFCAILGGTLTLVGSSPLILLNDLIQTSNENLPSGFAPMEAYHLFDVTPVGLALVITGIVYFVVAGRLVLPTTRGTTPDPNATTRYLEETYGIQGQIFEAQVTLDSPLVGMTIGDVDEQNRSVHIVGIRNADELLIAPPRDEMVWVGSIVAIMGTRNEVKDFAHSQALDRSTDMSSFIDVLNPSRAGISEVVARPGSNLLGKSIGEIRMRKRYGTTVLAVHRGEETLHDRLQSLALRAGDTLVLHSKWDDLDQLTKGSDFVVITDYPRETVRPKKVWHALSFFCISLGLILFTDLRLSLALFVGAAGMVVTRVLSIDEAYKAVSWQTVFLLASLLPLGIAVETTGTADWIAQQTLTQLGDMPIWMLQAVIAVFATFFTLVMSNVGATVLLVPLAVNIAIGAGGDPAVFALTVALATSNSFLVPTHQVNALIMGAAGYRVADFMRAGGVMTILFLVVMLITLQLVF